MSLDKTTLKNTIKNAYQTAQGKSNAEEAAEYLATQISNAIDVFVKSGTVDFTAGLVTGTCPSGGGPLASGTATEGTIS